jgi:hypothetical protein
MKVKAFVATVAGIGLARHFKKTAMLFQLLLLLFRMDLSKWNVDRDIYCGLR